MSNNKLDNNKLSVKEILQRIHDYQISYMLVDEIFKDEAKHMSHDFKFGWMSAVERLTKDLMGMIVGAVELPSQDDLHRSSLTRVLESWKKENANVHMCGGSDQSITTNSEPFECPRCHKQVKGIDEEVIKHFERITNGGDK